MSESFLPQDVISFLQTEYRNEQQQEGDVSVAEASKVWGNCSLHTAKARLDEMVKEGKMECLHGKLKNGAVGRFYRIVRSDSDMI